ncbi:uncharacterized protein MYCFIDRAFT_176788 [Pseudocercospora fijiensis CIRAD86]|uniref:Uncharacterized protein n=1 Tax=Pseudocercospora fijiensis (strain CIRAD86) TaxID=383855 RepID=M3AWJ3_PSEFD|nr:uncharacterized protein MYCFIDRAFT_176788 [Pseudocercospora fijiensis CIRAD86]EME81508.1 hypothetical protein MYCFIDRAFT_176788 [Pseudocercospora fijiensis CIRAD86]
MTACRHSHTASNFPRIYLTGVVNDLKPIPTGRAACKDGSSELRGTTWDSGSKAPHALSIREEIGASRWQHVAALVSKLLPQVLTADIALRPNVSSKGELVGFAEDDRPVLVQLEGDFDDSPFWTQQEALDLLRQQMYAEVAGDATSSAVEEALPQRAVPQSKSSWFGGRKQIKAAATKVTVAPKCLVRVEVELETVNFRTVTEYGLCETMRGRGVLLTVHVA